MGPLGDGLMMRIRVLFLLFLKDVKKMEEKDDELQTSFGATRCSIWGIELVRTGRRWSVLVGAGHRWHIAMKRVIYPSEIKSLPLYL